MGQSIAAVYGFRLNERLESLGPASLEALLEAYRDEGPLRNHRRRTISRSLAASALQKCIRRGLREQALLHCDQLLEIDPDYLFRRAHTIAAEDVGIGGLLVLAAYAIGGGSKTWRRKLGGDRPVARALVTALASSPKDRLGDELKTLDLRELGRLAEPWNRAVARQSDDELLGTLADRSQSVTARAAALMYYTRFQPSERNALVRRAGPKKNWRRALMEVCSALETPLLLRDLCWVYAGRMMERQAYCLPLAWDVSKDELWALEDDTGIDDLMFGGLLAASIDGHTGEGKKALANLLKRDRRAQNLATINVTRPSWDVRAFHLAFFRTEGHLCRQRVTNPMSVHVRQRSTHAVVSQYCRSPDNASDLLAHTPGLLSKLNLERLESIGANV